MGGEEGQGQGEGGQAGRGLGLAPRRVQRQGRPELWQGEEEGQGQVNGCPPRWASFLCPRLCRTCIVANSSTGGARLRAWLQRTNSVVMSRQAAPARGISRGPHWGNLAFRPAPLFF